MIVIFKELNVDELEKPCEKLEEAIKKLENIASFSKNYIFRGFKQESYKITTTYYRNRKAIRKKYDSNDVSPHYPEIQKAIEYFKSSLIRIGEKPLIPNHKSYQWLEYARHYGVPMPLLDFTSSPYIALFFAFNGIMEEIIDKEEYVKISAINIDALAKIWAKYQIQINRNGYEKSSDIQVKFLEPKVRFSINSLPNRHLKYIPFPSSINERMQRQMGVMIYDTMDYDEMNLKDLEGFIDEYKKLVDKEIEEPIINITINKSCVEEVFEKLELMAINGSMLFLNEEGVAMDIVNSFHCKPRARRFL